MFLTVNHTELWLYNLFIKIGTIHNLKFLETFSRKEVFLHYFTNPLTNTNSIKTTRAIL